MKRFILLLFATLLAVASATAQQTDSSTVLQFAHLFKASQGKALYELNAYNSSGSTLYLLVYDTYTGAVAGTANTVNTDWNTTNGVLTTEETHVTWATGTRFTFSTSDTSSLIDGRQYYLVYLTSSTFKIAASLSDALAGRTLILTGFASGSFALAVNAVPLPPIAVPTKSTACLSFQGRHFSDGIYAIFSTTDTTLTPAGPYGLFDANYR